MVETRNIPSSFYADTSIHLSRVLMLSTAMGAGGGAEEQVIQLAYGMKARGIEVRMVSMLSPSPMPADFEARGIPLSHLGMHRSIPDPRGVKRFNRIVREFRPDVVHTHLVHANLLGRIARITQPVPALVCTLHSLTMTGVNRDWSPVFEIAHRVTDGLCDRTTAICQAAADYAVRRRAVPAEKMAVIHNGIDTKRFSPRPDLRDAIRNKLGVGPGFVWLAVGRLEPVKGYAVLMESLRLLPDDGSILLVCGQGSLYTPLKSMADRLGLVARVRFLGLRDDVPEIMNAVDGMVLSSDIEGLPLVLLQAAASGLAIVATDVGGNRDVVAEGENGWLVPPRAPQNLAAGMARLMALPVQQRISMGQRGRERVCELFETDGVVDRWMALYESVLRDRGRTKKVLVSRQAELASAR